MRLAIAATLILLAAPRLNIKDQTFDAAHPRPVWLAAGIAEAAVGAAHATHCGPATSVKSLLDSFAVNVHLQQGGQYSDATKTVSTLKDLGITQIRDAFPGLGHAGLEYAASEGIRFDFVINSGWGIGVIKALEEWERTYPGSILAIEGPNEVNNWPVTYQGQTGVPAAQAFQRDLYDAVHASPVLKAIPVVALTSWPVFENKSDIGNIHAYARSGAFMTLDIQKAVEDERSRNPPVKPIWMTEAGYHTHIGNDHDEGVSEPLQARMIAAALLSAFEQGIQKTFLYQLADQYTDPNDEQSHFGLVDQSWREKPAFSLLKNMIAILRMTDSQPAFRGTLDYELQGLPATAHQKLFQTDRGIPTLAVWDETVVWDRSTKREVDHAPASVTLKLGQVASQISLFDPSIGVQAVQAVQNADAFTFRLPGQPLLIKISPRPSSGCSEVEVAK